MVQFIAALPHRLRSFAPPSSPALTLSARDALRWREMVLVVMFQLGVALLLRGATLGFPAIHIDEQFYLLVGDRMLQGAVPYVDIWDRKPVGLFLLFAAMRAMGGDGILQYQLIALASVVATSLVIYRLARAHASPQAALAAGVVYQCYLSAFFCYGGQAPVYYNLLMALAGLGMLRVWTTPDDRRLVLHGAAIMALVGISIQMKYTVVFEGFAFGLALMAHAHRVGWHRWAILGAASLWCAIALLPTAAAWGAYVAMGYGEQFVQTNFLSIFGRHEAFLGSLWRLTKECLALLPLGLAILWAPRHLPAPSPDQADARGFLRYWAGAAVLGFLIFGTWYDHYVAPLLVPLVVLAAPAFAPPRRYRWLAWYALGFSALAALVVTVANMRHQGEREAITAMAEMIRPRLGDGCLYVNEGDPILYQLTGSCLPSHYAFPNHLNNESEKFALGTNVNGEMRAILRSKPSVVVMQSQPFSKPVNWESRRILLSALARDYDRFAIQQAGARSFELYALKPRSDQKMAGHPLANQRLARR